MRAWCLFLGWAGLIVGGVALGIGAVLLIQPGSAWITPTWLGAVMFPSGVLFATLAELLGRQQSRAAVTLPAPPTSEG